jgi:membrane associated rhomboid family serine protease
MTPSIRQILSGTPIWVFALLAYLLFIGATRLKPGVRDLAKIWITPGIFIVWGLFGLFQRPGDFSEVLLRWAVGLVVGVALGLAFSIPMQADRARRRFTPT